MTTKHWQINIRSCKPALLLCYASFYSVNLNDMLCHAWNIIPNVLSLKLQVSILIKAISEPATETTVCSTQMHFCEKNKGDYIWYFMSDYFSKVVNLLSPKRVTRKKLVLLKQPLHHVLEGAWAHFAKNSLFQIPHFCPSYDQQIFVVFIFVLHHSNHSAKYYYHLMERWSASVFLRKMSDTRCGPFAKWGLVHHPRPPADFCWACFCSLK